VAGVGGAPVAGAGGVGGINGEGGAPVAGAGGIDGAPVAGAGGADNSLYQASMSCDFSQAAGDTVGGILNSSIESAIDSRATAALGGVCGSGYTICVAYDGEIAYTKSFGGHGTADRRDWASISKPLTGVIGLQLHEQGKVDYGRPFWEYDTAVDFESAVSQNHLDRPATLQDLLGHLAGVNHFERETSANLFNGTTVGTYDYSTSGYGIVGRIWESLDDRTYKQMAEQLVGAKINAPSITSSPEKFNSPGYAIESTIRDLCAFGVGVIKGSFILKTTFTTHMEQKIPGSNRSWGGFKVNGTGNEVRLNHTGDNGSPKAFLDVYPRKGIVIGGFGTCVSDPSWYDMGDEMYQVLTSVTDACE
jgi:CubicO group peptidase (beta-lactamase class C family)